MRGLLLIVGIIVLSACGGSDSGNDEKPAGVIPQHMLSAMDKAEEVNKLIQEREEARRKLIDGEE